MRAALSGALLGCILTSSGCAVVDASREVAASVRNAITPRTWDRRDPTDEVDSWTSEVGMDARGNRTRDKDPDAWWGKYVVSDKAREIEKNLGVDYE